MAKLMSAAFLAGLGLLAFGCWLAWHPAGFIVAGLSLIVIPIVWVRGTWASSTS
jgi:hypothetical protein